MPSATVRPTFVFCIRHFSKGMIQKIRDMTPPEWTIQETEEPVRATQVGANVLFLLSGSDHAMAVRFAGGSAAGRFSITLNQLRDLFSGIV